MKKQINNNKYFIYARKSSESEDRQVASIDDQITELKKLAHDLGLNVVDILFESKSAKNPGGRSVFNNMLGRIHKGEANGVICWKLNRLARNPIDGGQISWMLQQSTIQHIQTYGRSYYPTDNVLMMAVELGMANQFVRDLSVDTKRGLRNRAVRGLPNGVAHIGYINDLTKEKGKRDWIKDPIRYPLVKDILTMFLSGKYTVPQLHRYAKNKMKLTTIQRKKLGGRPIALSYMYLLLRDPIHAGFFYQKSDGKQVRYEFNAFEPMISEPDYWKIQDMLGSKGRQRITKREATYHQFAKCGTCNGMLSPDFKFQVICSKCKKKFSYLNQKECPSCNLAIEKMKSPKFLTYIFYYCINNKKHRTNCPESGIEEKSLEQQLGTYLEQNLAISKELSEWCIDNIGKLKDKAIDDEINIRRNLENEKNVLKNKIERLTMLRISTDRTEQENKDFDAIKKKLDEDLALIELKLSDSDLEWFSEASKNFNLMSEVLNVFQNGTPEQKQDILRAFGSNLTVSAKKLTVTNKKSIEAVKTYLLESRASDKAFEPAIRETNKRKSTTFSDANSSWLPG